MPYFGCRLTILTREAAPAPQRGKRCSLKFKVDELRARIAGGVPHVVAITGGEEFLRREAEREILAAVHGGAPPPEDSSRVGARAPTPDDLRSLYDELRTPSLFGGARSIVVENAAAYLAVDLDGWAEFLKTSWRGATLLLRLETIDLRTRVAKALDANGWIIQADKPFHRPPPWKPGAPPWENDLNRWIVARARAEGLAIDPPAAHFLQCRAGTSLGDLANVLERLRTVLGERGQVTRDAIEAHTPDGEDATLFELVDLFFLQDRRKLIEVTASLLARGAAGDGNARIFDPAALLLQFIGATLSRVRQLRTVHAVLASGGGEEEILRAAGIARPFLPRLRQMAQATPPHILDSIVAELRRTDADFKRGRVPHAGELLERLAIAGRLSRTRLTRASDRAGRPAGTPARAPGRAASSARELP